MLAASGSCWCLAEMSEMIIAEWLVEIEGGSMDNP